ncbi:hypothetical protein E3N88_27119 [Mikania micrantha]|uniref:Uncharacterized protein n=1 Tax=Mikania micrantha TaxID=192012 RepID=A0A5N6MVX9_9ASTR|nr:hypothetical protein E3N88_27119 [Mikania micrantha]
MNMNGEVAKVVSANKCFFGEYLVNKMTNPFLVAMKVQNIRCRFPYYSWDVYSHPFKVEVNTQFLSQHVTHIIYILFKYGGTQYAPCYIPFQYKLDKEMNYYTSCIPYISEADGWAATKLYQFTSNEAIQNFCIEFLPRDRIPFRDEFAFEGIEFQPLESTTCEKQDEEQMDNDFLPSDFTDVIKLSKEVIHWSTNKELYAHLRKGFLIMGATSQTRFWKDHYTWFSISKNMKKCFMIPASIFLDEDEWTCNSVPELESRFKVATKSLISYQFSVHLSVNLHILSPQTKHLCYLIYKLPNTNNSSFDGPAIIDVTDCSKDRMFPLSICLNTHCHPPIIGSACNDDNRYSINMKDHSKPRKDGWMEVKFSEVSITSTGSIKESYKFSAEEDKFVNKNFLDIVIEGIEFRPL